MCDEDQHYQLHAAARAGDVSAVARLLAEGVSPGCPDALGLTPLHVAVLEGQVAVVELLLAQGADVNARDRDGQTPLFYVATGLGSDTELTLVNRLIAQGADVQARYAHERTVLYETVDEATFELVVASGADLEVRDAYGWTVLHYAVNAGTVGKARILLEHGANPHSASDTGVTPLHVADGDHWIDAETRGTAGTELLLQYGADPHARDTAGRTPLDYTVEAGRADLVEILTGFSGAAPSQSHRGKPSTQ